MLTGTNSTKGCDTPSLLPTSMEPFTNMSLQITLSGLRALPTWYKFFAERTGTILSRIASHRPLPAFIILFPL